MKRYSKHAVYYPSLAKFQCIVATDSYWYGKTWGLSMSLFTSSLKTDEAEALCCRGVIPRTCGFEPMARPQVPPERKQTATFFLPRGSMSSGLDIVFTSSPKTIFFCCIIRIIISILITICLAIV